MIASQSSMAAQCSQAALLAQASAARLCRAKRGGTGGVRAAASDAPVRSEIEVVVVGAPPVASVPRAPLLFRHLADAVNEPALDARQQQHQLGLLRRRQHLAQL